MHRILTTTGLAVLVLGLMLAMFPTAAQAQMCYPAPVVSYYTPVTTYYAPPVATYSYYTPMTTYYSPAPVVSYYAPVTSYYAPAYSPGWGVTTRTYRSYGVFRPRGIYTQSYYTPGTVSYFYRPVWP